MIYLKTISLTYNFVKTLHRVQSGLGTRGWSIHLNLDLVWQQARVRLHGPRARVQNGIWQHWVDGGAGKDLRMLLLQKLPLQGEEQRAPLVIPLLGPLIPQSDATSYYFSYHQTQIAITLGQRHRQVDLAACVELLVSQVWRGQHLDRCEGKQANPGRRCWAMLSHAVLWDRWGLGVLILVDFVSRLKRKSPVDTSVQTELVSEW